MTDRYETGSKRHNANNKNNQRLRDLIEEGRSKAAGDENPETRSLHTELDYSKKDAVRHIVKGGAG